MKLLEVNVIKNYAYGNPNRDITGAPKSGTFGDELRGRMSSQSLNRTIRKSSFFSDLDTKGIILDICGERTTKLYGLTLESLNKLGDYSKYAEEIQEQIKKIGKKEDTTSDKDVMQLYSSQDIAKIVEILKEQIDTYGNLNKCTDDKGKSVSFSLEKKLIECMIRPVSLDILMFGRMAATNSFTTVEGCCQVAHALGTHKLKTHTDFFTAVDDVKERMGEQGAGHLDDREFTSNCFYMYYAFDIDSFVKNLKKWNVVNIEVEESKLREIASEVAIRFIRAICELSPKGMQSSMATNPPISAVMIQLKKSKINMTYSNAFLNPAKTNQDGNIVENSISNFVNYVNKVDKVYGVPEKRYWINLDGKDDVSIKNAEVSESLFDLMASVKKDILED